MLPMQRKKVDLSSMTEEEKKLFAKYGRLPTHKNVLSKMQKERKYFDSGDYAMSKAGVESPAAVGTAIPQPESIPHASSPAPHSGTASSPTGANGTSPPNDTPLRHHSESVVETLDSLEAKAAEPSTSETAPAASEESKDA